MFSGKVVLVTGASSGIGATTAIHFACEGAKLALTGRVLENLQDTAQKCEAKNNLKPLLIKADLTRDDDIKTIMQTTVETYGRLDVLVNNAGVFFPVDFENPDMEKYDQIFATNVRAIFLLSSLALPHLKCTKGNIVNVSSVTGLRSFPFFTAYGMSKAALDQYTRTLALVVAPQQVRVNSVNPGLIPTNLPERSGLSDNQVDELFESCKKFHPVGRPGTTDEVAEAIVFLASEKSSFTTGVTFSVDGGWKINTCM